MKMFTQATAVGLLVAAPLVTFAADLQSVLNMIGQLIGAATPIVVALALVYFFWGLGNFILGSGSEEKRKEAIAIMIYGILALFVMVSVWGIVNVLQSTFGIQGGGDIRPPKVQGVGNY